MRNLVPKLTLAFGLLLGAAGVFASEDQDLYDNGRDAVFEERWRDARKIFEDLTRRFPASPYTDDAHYWLGMALYEMGDAEKAYAILKGMSTRFPESPWNDDSRVLMVRCAEQALRSADSRASGGSAAMYEAFIEKSTLDRSAKVQLLAIDTLLETNPGKAPELLPRLSTSRTSREAAGMVLDHFFGSDQVKVTLENPVLGLREGNVAVMVRQGERITYLSLTETTDLLRSPAGGARFDEAILSEIRDKLLQAERNLVRDGDPGTVEGLAGLGSNSMSAIVRVVDGEIHYYRNGDETLRILVLRRQAGFTSDNIKIFAETRAGVREIGLSEARALPSGEGPGPQPRLSEATARYLKAALAIIQIDLTRTTGAAR